MADTTIPDAGKASTCISISAVFKAADPKFIIIVSLAVVSAVHMVLDGTSWILTVIVLTACALVVVGRVMDGMIDWIRSRFTRK